MILRDRDTNGDGTLDERVYSLQNWRHDVVALITDTGTQVERVRYEPYGSAFGIPAGDTDGDGDVDTTDVNQVTAWKNAPAYDICGDLDVDGDIDTADVAAATAANGDGLGLYRLSLVGNRKGYAGYELLAELSESKWDVRSNIFSGRIGEHLASSIAFGCTQLLDPDDGLTLECENCELLVQQSITDPCSCWSLFNPLSPLLWQEYQLITSYGCAWTDPICTSKLGSGGRTNCHANGGATIMLSCANHDCALLLHEMVHARQCCSQYRENCPLGPCEGPAGPQSRLECLEWETEAYEISGICNYGDAILDTFCLCQHACESCERADDEDHRATSEPVLS